MIQQSKMVQKKGAYIMKFMKTFKMGFNMFALEKMTHPKSIGVSKSSLGKMYAAEMAYKAGSKLKK